MTAMRFERCGSRRQRSAAGFALASCLAGWAGALAAPGPNPAAKLKGRFLHVTDLHPDAHYQWKSGVGSACHRKPRADGETTAGYWGTPVSDCDSPPSLMNATFTWLARNWADEVDFVVWTGDSARHDSDSQLPRTLDEIFGSNLNLAQQMSETFNVAVVPCIGNNDVFPHNVQFGGPSRITAGFAKIWSDFIPEDMYHTFARGAYFAVDVIPKRLAVISLNSLYFYDANKVVDGCPLDESGIAARRDPGTEELQWLEVQLDRYREQGMHVYLIGHVPPSPADWYEGCYRWYGNLSLEYQDTILGHFYGHINIDHFSWIDAKEVKGKKGKQGENKDVVIYKDEGALERTIRAKFKSLPRRRKTDERDYAIIHTAPSVVPTFLPAARIWVYNITESGDASRDGAPAPAHGGGGSAPASAAGFESFRAAGRFPPQQLPFSNESPAALDPRHAPPRGPAHVNRFLTPLGYTQFVMDLESANRHSGYGPGKDGKTRREQGGERPHPEWRIEYTTATKEKVAEAVMGEGEVPLLFPQHVAPKGLCDLTAKGEVLDALTKKGGDGAIQTWDMGALTVGEWLALGRKLGKSKRAWKQFKKAMYVSSGAEKD